MASPPRLLTRDQFREGVFARDQHRCVVCKAPAVDAHHIIERRLWPDGGYYLENGASVCTEHHLACERTTISVEEIRDAAGIARAVLPAHLYPDQSYDKWGNPILPNGQRSKGELFHDESVQKVLRDGGALELFGDRVKYPRTHHLPWSPGIHDDDRVLASMDGFVGKRVIVTEKMDGENTTGYCDGYIHARSIDGRSHITRDWVKAYWAQRASDLPEAWRLCGENLFAVHSIHYDALPSLFLAFSIWNEHNVCLGWDESVEWFALLGVPHVPVLYDGVYDEAKIKALYDGKLDHERREGYVLRVADAIPFAQFRTHVGKFVRKDHIQTAPHNWMRRTDFKRNAVATE